MKKHIFRNPIKEALYTQGKKWTVSYLLATAMLIPVSMAAFWVGMDIMGTIGAVAEVFCIGFFACWFGIETVSVEE